MVARVTKLTKDGVGALGNHLLYGGPLPSTSGEEPKKRPTTPGPGDEVSAPVFGAVAWNFDDEEIAERLRRELEKVEAGEVLENRLERDGIPVTWWTGQGALAPNCGLSGATDAREMMRILGLGHLSDGQQIHAPCRDGKERMPAWSVIYAAPKTLSLLSAHPDPAVRGAVTTAMQIASDQYLQILAENMTTRRKQGGVVSEGIRGLLVVTAHHLTSSAGDPHLHAHFVISASAPAVSDGSWLALDGKRLFQVQKMAEAAANRRLRDELSRRLGLAEDDWIRVEAGSAPAFELIRLRDAVPVFSQSRMDLQAVARAAGVDFDARSSRMDAALWRRYRQTRIAVGEALEHALDVTLMAGGPRAANLRKLWRNTGDLGDALAGFRALPTAPAEAAPLQKDWADLALPVPVTEVARNTLDRLGLSDDLQARLEALPVPSRLERIQAALPFNSAVKARIAEADEARLTLERDVALAQAAEQQIADATRRTQLRADADAILRDLTQTLGTFTVADLPARLMALHGYTVTEAHQQSAHLLQYWSRSGQLHTRDGFYLDGVLRVLEAGGVSEITADLHRLGAPKALVPDVLVRAEMALREQAAKLASSTRQSFLIALPERATSEQTVVIRSVAQGHALSVTTGVAGAGKSFLARPIADAAQRQGFQVRVLSRNRSLGEDLAVSLGLGRDAATTLASFDPTDGASTRTLWIVGEAGLIDQADMAALLAALEANREWQAWMLGDRLQAQPIDRKASFAAVVDAVHPQARTHLDKSYHCRAWSWEQDALRAGRTAVIEAIQRDGRQITAKDAEDKIHWMAQLVEDEARHGRTALALSFDNATVASVAEVVQVLRGIQVDENTRLRFGQKCGVGDRVRTRQNDRRKGLRNGQVWTVRETGHTGGLLLQAEKGRRVWVDADYAATAVELAYAGTVGAAQGVTVDRAILDVSGMGRSLLYSGATRGGQAPVYVSVAEEGLMQALGRKDYAPMMLDLLNPTSRKVWKAIHALQDAIAGPRPPEEVEERVREIAALAQMIQKPDGRWSTGQIDLDSYLAESLTCWTQTATDYAEKCAGEYAAQLAEAKRATEKVLAGLPAAIAQLKNIEPESLGSASVGYKRAEDLVAPLGIISISGRWLSRQMMPDSYYDEMQAVLQEWGSAVDQWIEQRQREQEQRQKIEKAIAGLPDAIAQLERLEPVASTIRGWRRAEDLVAGVGIVRQDDQWSLPGCQDDRLEALLWEWSSAVDQWMDRCQREDERIEQILREAAQRQREQWIREMPAEVEQLRQALDVPYWETDLDREALLCYGFDILDGRLTYHGLTSTNLNALKNAYVERAAIRRKWPGIRAQLDKLAKEIDAAGPEQDADIFRSQLHRLESWVWAEDHRSPQVQQILDAIDRQERVHETHVAQVARQRQALIQATEVIKQQGWQERMWQTFADAGIDWDDEDHLIFVDETALKAEIEAFSNSLKFRQEARDRQLQALAEVTAEVQTGGWQPHHWELLTSAELQRTEDNQLTLGPAWQKEDSLQAAIDGLMRALDAQRQRRYTEAIRTIHYLAEREPEDSEAERMTRLGFWWKSDRWRAPADLDTSEIQRALNDMGVWRDCYALARAVMDALKSWPVAQDPMKMDLLVALEGMGVTQQNGRWKIPAGNVEHRGPETLRVLIGKMNAALKVAAERHAQWVRSSSSPPSPPSSPTTTSTRIPPPSNGPRGP